MGATHANPSSYTEGTSFAFKDPETVAGYTFMGWNPSAITATMTGSQVITATWRPNAPSISPADGTILAASTSVNIASDAADATIYYTTDGTEPTTSSLVYKRFKVSTKMTVKAIAVVEGMAWSETTTAEYALGQCADPSITPADGTVFGNSNYQVEIAKNGEKGVLRYTTDGSEPTETSPVYDEPFAISETTTVKARTFDANYFDSAVVCATLTRQWTKVATPAIVAPDSFTGTKLSVALTCETADAVIRYTTDGSEPNSHSAKYGGHFEVTATTVVKAIAFKTDCAASDVATKTITRQWCIGDALNESDREFSTDTAGGWVRETSVSHDGVESMKSGAIDDSPTTGVYSESSLTTVVHGKGTVRFWWKASCEEDDAFEWDHGEFRVDGKTLTNINGSTGWTNISHDISTEGSHTLTWVYCKDDFGKEGDDCIWVDEFSWTANDPIPDLGDNPTSQQVFDALKGSSDAALLANITDGENYGKYRAWAGKVKKTAGGELVGDEAVKSAPHTWLSFALDTETMIETLPDTEDIRIDAFSPTATDGRFDFAVGIENICVGADATTENLKKVFSIEGGRSLDDMSSENVEISSCASEAGKVTFTAGPKDADAPTFFMKVKMTP